MATPAPAAPQGGAAVAAATALVVLSALCFGSNSILTVVATRAGVPLLSVLFWRYALAAPMLTVAAGGPRALPLPRQRAVPLLVLGGGGQALIMLLALSSLAYVSAATLGFLFYTYPAWVALLAVARRTERLDLRRGLALVLSLAGIAVMIGAPGAAALHPAGVALALGAAVVYALFIPLIGRLQRGIAPAVASVYVVVAAGALFAVAAAATGRLTAALPPAAWGAVAGLALVSTTLGFITFLRGLAVLGPVRTAIVSTIEPFWIAVLGAVALGQPLAAPTLLGGALIAAAVVLLQRQPTP